MRLVSLKLRNFKGCREFDLSPQGEDINIYGDNGTGKTTIADAFSYLLFGKDSQNKSDFEIKTLDANGQPIHNLDHEVEALLDIGDKGLLLKKVYKEKWTKQRGSATHEFTGHTVDYYIDGVPVKANEFNARIEEVAGKDDNFKLLTNPRYFCDTLHWEKRRSILMDVCGDVTDAEVIASDAALSTLPDILGNRLMADHKKVIASRKSEINKELTAIPTRIDEAHRSLPETADNITPEVIEGQIKGLRQKRSEKEQEAITIDAGGGLAEKKKELADVDIQLIDLDREQNEIHYKKVQGTRGALDHANRELTNVESSRDNKKSLIIENNTNIIRIQGTMELRRQDWAKVIGEEFDSDQFCPTCKQPMPQELIEEARERFNQSKASRLAAIVEEGKSLKVKVEELEKSNSDIHEEIESLDWKCADIKKQIADIETKLNGFNEDKPNTPEYDDLLKQKETIQKAIDAINAGGSEQKDAITADIKSLDGEIVEAERQLSQIANRQKTEQRIQELGEEEKNLSAEYEKLEKELFLCESFIKAKVTLLEEKINSRFQLASFKMYEEQVNGGIAECCEAIYNGVPYGSGLNSGAKMNIGLDIINTLSGQYGFSAPIFIDNAESVSEIIETEGQQIRLVVSAEDKALRIG